VGAYEQKYVDKDITSYALHSSKKKVIVEEFFDGPSLRDHRKKKKREVGSLSLLLQNYAIIGTFLLENYPLNKILSVF
jgi:hypothetical protein